MPPNQKYRRNLRIIIRKSSAAQTPLYPDNLMPVEQIIEDYPTIHMLSAPDANLDIAMAHAHHPDVIPMDIKLPGIDGFPALKILHEDPATTHILVIALSVNAMPHEIKKGLQSGNPSRLMT